MPVSRMSALQISPHRSSAPEAGLHAAGRAAGDEGGCRCHIGGTHVPEQDNRLVEPQPTVQPGFSLVAHDWSQHPRPALRPEHERQFSSCFVHSSTAPATLLSVLNTPTSNTHRSAHTARSACYRTVPPRGPPRVRLSALLHTRTWLGTARLTDEPACTAGSRVDTLAGKCTGHDARKRCDRSSRLKDVPLHTPTTVSQPATGRRGGEVVGSTSIPSDFWFLMAPTLLSKTGQETLPVHGLYDETTQCRIRIIDGPRGLIF